MEAAVASVLDADYQRLGLRTRGRSHGTAGCHAPGCHHRAAAGKRFCAGCQATLDRVRNELKAGSPRGRRKRFNATA